MATLPVSGDDFELITLALQSRSSDTYKLEIDRNRIRGRADGREAARQAVYLILNVERYAYPIYSRNYGIELADLAGKPKDYAMSEMKRRITQALTQDERITGVDQWEFILNRNKVLVSFTVHTVFGELEGITEEVAI